MTLPLRLLLVEDSEPDASLILRQLSRGGYEVQSQRVETAAQLEAALDAGSWDLVVSDHSMPGFRGLEALRIIEDRGLDIPFLFVSGTLGEETAVRAMKVGARDYIMKNNLSRLVPAIQRELHEARLRREHQLFEQRMTQLERFEALGKLASGIAHDFNNVLGAILGWAELGAKTVPAGSPAAESFRQIGEQLERAAGLTRHLLAYARKQTLEPRRVDLNRLIQQIVSLLKTVIGSGTDLELNLAPDLQPTRADPSQIDRVLMNLCINARDAMPHGGVLRLSTSNEKLDEEACFGRRFALPGNYVLVSVADSGTGIDQATMEHLFEPFFTTKPEGEGTGLGLATSLGIVNQHGGFIDVSSSPGQGSIFRVYLPVSHNQESATPQPVFIPAAETVLVVDDHEGMRTMAGQVLEAYGYRPLLAADGAEALRQLDAHRDSVALALIDVTLPGADGFEVYRRLSARKPGLPVIFISGRYAGDLLVEAEGKTILQKPFSPKDLLAKVRSLLDARSAK